jgi:hypothetical protein
MLEERKIQEKLRKIKEERRPISLEEIKHHEQSVEKIIAQRNEEKRSRRIDAHLTHIEKLSSVNM